MNAIPELAPISDLRLRQSELLSRLDKGPVVLTQRGRAAVVLVDPDYWNQVMEELEDLRDALDAVEAYDAHQREPGSARPWEDIRAELKAEGRLDASRAAF
jgi:prevent-host-death family protein